MYLRDPGITPAQLARYTGPAAAVTGLAERPAVAYPCGPANPCCQLQR